MSCQAKALTLEGAQLFHDLNNEEITSSDLEPSSNNRSDNTP